MPTRGASLSHSIALLIAICCVVSVSGWLLGPYIVLGGLSVRVAIIVGLAGFLVAVTGYLITKWFVHRSLGPVIDTSRALREAAVRPRDQISHYRARRLLDRRAPPEIRELCDAVSLLLDRIESRHREQTAWMGAVVHDLKTPILASANALSIVATTATMQADDRIQLLRDVTDELRRLASNTQRVLDVMRLERDDVELDVEHVDLRSVVEAVARRVDARVQVSTTTDVVGTVLADVSLLERALDNLVSNALRYARSSVSVHVAPGLVRIADDGPGLPAPFEHLAQPFRSESITVGDVRVSGGASGIGLFVARRVLELHGGKLVVESTGRNGTVLLAYVGGRERARA